MAGQGKAYADVVYEVIKLKGFDVLLDAKLFANCTRDVAGVEWSAEYRIAERNLDSEMLKAFHDAAQKGTGEVQATSRRVVDQLRYDCGLSELIAESIAQGLESAVLGYVHDEELYAAGEKYLASKDYRNAREAFSSIGNHRDAPLKVSECDELIKQDQEYEKAKNDFGNAMEESQFLELAETFKRFDGYKASRKWASKCIRQAEKANEAELMYRDAKEILLDDTLSSSQYRSGEQLFKQVEWYKDSSEGARACKQLADEANDYECSIAIVDGESSASELSRAINMLQTLGAYRDADAYLKAARVKLEKQNMYEAAVITESEAKEPLQYEEACKQYRMIGEYRDAIERGQRCWDRAARLRQRELERREAAYQNAVVQLGQAQSLEEHEQALEAIEVLAGFRDADVLAEKCRERIAELEWKRDYERAKEAFDSAETIQEYEEAAALLRALGYYEDALELAERAETKARNLQKEDKYRRATQAMNASSTESSFRNVASRFEELHDYKDSQERERRCLVKAEELRTQAELELKEKQYMGAVTQMETAATADEYAAACNLFSGLGEYQDSPAKAKVCHERAEEERIKQKYAQALKQMESATSEYAFLKLADEFKALKPYKDSAELEAQCLRDAQRIREQLEKDARANQKRLERQQSLEKLRRTLRGIGIAIAIAAIPILMIVGMILRYTLLPS